MADHRWSAAAEHGAPMRADSISKYEREDDGATLDLARRYIRVVGVRCGFIEFEFTIADPMLTIELVMPPSAFDEFCRAQGANISAADDVEQAFARLRERSAGQSKTASTTTSKN
ncbi:hypothetical protein MPC4_290061 [Methylocella tundrae]|uniref:Phenol hydroxylase n=2 Tax=Methylocella tundrae TaxID=227605 RepID=A0A8B6M9U5_METTU|nr:hypothetical protein MPC1_1450004 [Methylocella tundrae]VTZ50814.1 hypothetical protein MPC4_290061 [Methylocella tundrae]